MDDKFTKQGFPKTDLLGDDLNRRGLLAKKITEVMPEYSEHYDEINDRLRFITYGKYSFFLHLCYSRKIAELKTNVDLLLKY